MVEMEHHYTFWTNPDDLSYVSPFLLGNSNGKKCCHILIAFFILFYQQQIE